MYLGGNLRWLPLIYQGQLRPHARYQIQPSPGQFWIPHCGRCGHTATVFQAMEVRISCQWNLDSRFQSFAGSLITQAGLQIPKPRTLDPTRCIRMGIQWKHAIKEKQTQTRLEPMPATN